MFTPHFLKVVVNGETLLPPPVWQCRFAADVTVLLINLLFIKQVVYLVAVQSYLFSGGVLQL